jgi:hypothetical protein
MKKVRPRAVPSQGPVIVHPPEAAGSHLVHAPDLRQAYGEHTVAGPERWMSGVSHVCHLHYNEVLQSHNTPGEWGDLRGDQVGFQCRPALRNPGITRLLPLLMCQGGGGGPPRRSPQITISIFRAQACKTVMSVLHPDIAARGTSWPGTGQRPWRWTSRPSANRGQQGHYYKDCALHLELRLVCAFSS